MRHCSSEILANYKLHQLRWKTHIRMEPRKSRRFWMWIWYFIAFPWVWIFYNIRDWHTALIFVIVCAAVSSEVWVPYLLALIFWNNEPWRIGLLSFGSACWIFWAGPGTPFLVICITITIGIKSLFNRHSEKRNNKNNNNIQDGTES